MVVFTCNHCGDSLKKGAVEKHYNTKCRGGKVFVTCMDCLKDFKEQEYVAHTKCISEKEKYSGKDYVPKPSLNKGQKKQDNWIEMIRSILVSSDYELKPVTRTIFERLQNYENVPRKKVKFENFVQNSFKINKSLVPEVWGILEKEMIKIKNPNPNNDSNPNDSKPNESKKNGQKNEEKQDVKSETPEDENLNGDMSKEKKDKKKSKKRKAEEATAVNPTQSDDKVLAENGDAPEKKKKKKNKNKDKNDNEIISNGNENLTENSHSIEKTEVKTSVKTEIEPEVETNGLASQTDGKFDWFVTISKNAKDGMPLEKLQKKVLKKYKKFLNVDEFENTNKAEKTFKKYLKKLGINIENNFVKSVS